MSHFLQASKVKEEKHDEEVTQKEETCHLEPGAKILLSINKKWKGAKFSQKKLLPSLSHDDIFCGAIAHFSACDSARPSFNVFRSDPFS